VTQNGRVVGVINERTLLEHALTLEGQKTPVGQLADADFCTVTEHTEVQILADLLRRFKVALVMQNSNLIRILSRIDIIDYIAKSKG
jgi:cystathionine beta-synthase